jgi:phosphoglycerate dehydrogenase-like enzyme
VLVLDSSDIAVETEALKGVAKVVGLDKHFPAEVTDEFASKAIACIAWHTIDVDATLLKRMPKCRAVVRTGAGFDRIDGKTAGSLGIAVCNTPAYGTEEVADTAFSLLLNLYRWTLWLEREIAKGKEFHGITDVIEVAKGSRRIRGKTLGLIGVGAIGTALALRAKAFGFNVAFYDPYVPDGVHKSIGVLRVETLEELLKMSDCLSLHCPLTPGTKHILNRETLKLVQDGVFIVNTSRGGLIDEAALAEALKSGKVGGAGLDVQDTEPSTYQTGSLKGAPNLILTPHAGWYSKEAMIEARETAAKTAGTAIKSHSADNLRNFVNKRDFVPNEARWK